MEKFRECRKAAGLTQTKVGKMLGVSQQYINRIESGEKEPSWKNVKALARVYNVPTDAFLETPTAVTNSVSSEENEMERKED